MSSTKRLPSFEPGRVRRRFGPVTILAVACTVFIGSCAVPIPPSGGPPDTTPPVLVSSVPTDGDVEVTTDRIVLRFDEFVDERSLGGAITITPSTGRAPAIRYGGREVELRFDGALRDSTTFILTIDSGFRDAHGVALDSPIRIAFSTGPEIDRGRLAGRVVEWDRGAPAAGIDVFAYNEGTDPTLATEPAYRTQTDREGSFSFAYLPARRFSVVAVRDANRNRRVDTGEWFASGSAPSFLADSAAAEILVPFVLSGRDVEPPEVRRVDVLSGTRLQVRFSEPVRPADDSGAGFSIGDSTGTGSVPVLHAYRGTADDRSIYLVTGPLPAGSLRLHIDAAAVDTVGNPVAAVARDLVASTEADTLVARLRALVVDSLMIDGSARRRGNLVLAPWSTPSLVFDHSPGRTGLRLALSVTDTSLAPVAFDLTSLDGLSWEVRPSGFAGPWQLHWSDSEFVRFDTVRVLRFEPAPASALGEISGSAAPSDSTWLVTLVPSLPAGSSNREPDRTVAPDRTGVYLFSGLPASNRYRFRVFADLNGDGRWTPGSLAPWRAAEPIGWGAEAPAVRPRWETVVEDTLRLGLPAKLVRAVSVDQNEPDS